MASEVDKTLPTDNVKASKSDFRAQFTIIYNEITALQARTSVAGAKTFYNFVEQGDLDAAVTNAVTIQHAEQTGVLARDIAFGRVAINS